MKKINTSAISGMQELLPASQAEFNRLKDQIAVAFAAHGFLNIETPTIERTEILLAKAGGDTEKQIYKVIKTDETAADADQALRFDHTVPLARYTVEHMNDLAFPFKVSQIGRNFRGERAQKGRFREFYQCDVDVIGWGKLSLAYDADVISTLADALSRLPLPGNGFLVRISNRKLLSGLLSSLNLDQHAAAIFSIIDHAEKVSLLATETAFTNLGLGSENVAKLLAFIDIRGDRESVCTKLRGLGITDATFLAGIDELETVLLALEKQGLGDLIVSDMLIVRGLDYYTGTVFETIVPEHREIGSICSGGRYENLASHYTQQSLPGVGGSIGLTRLFYLLERYGCLRESATRPVEYCLVPISDSELAASYQLATKLRRLHTVDIVHGDKKLGDKLKYASKTANFAIVIGENEVKADSFTVKNLATGETSTLLL